jgi:cytochrome P450
VTTARIPGLDPVSLSTPAFWALPPAERDAAFAALRREAPVSWQPPTEGGLRLVDPGPADGGYWAVVRYDDVVSVSRDSETFISGAGITLEPIPAELVEITASIIGMDGGRHDRFRHLVSSAFTPKQVARTEAQIQRQARSIVDGLIEHGPGDFVELVSRRLPMWTVSEMVGVPDADRERVSEAANRMVAWNDPEHCGDQHPLDLFVGAMIELRTAAMELAEYRRRQPAEDLISGLVHAEVDGTRLTDDEIGAFFVLLSVAGNDTTRNTISHAMLALSEHPQQRQWLTADFDGRIKTAVEEMVRWATPVINFRRTASRDVRLRGQVINAGDWVVLFYSSANRDEDAFTDPGRFDLSRHPNHHLGFGGGGPHFCLGAFLARTQLRAIFDQLLRRLPDLTAGDPEYLVSNFINGIKRLPCTFETPPT